MTDPKREAGGDLGFPAARRRLRLGIVGGGRGEDVRLNAVGQPSQVISRGLAAGMGAQASRFARMPRRHPEALTDASAAAGGTWVDCRLEL